ncbi:hypothetical protein HHI36_003299 [Cryptolaemus montrouzieri]|uniref:Ig-like domain-containing protein n=1 Tax=Cryptolaemus montrouzieri TaxID=559131 RepID=A0ABD2PDR0_9CUCU
MVTEAAACESNELTSSSLGQTTLPDEVYQNLVPDGVPVITLDKSSLEQGGPLITDCSAPASFPALNLTWYVNDQRVPGSTSYWTTNDGEQLRKSYSRLELTGVGGSWGDIRLRCEANLFRLFRANSVEVSVKPDVPQPASVLLMESSQTGT